MQSVPGVALSMNTGAAGTERRYPSAFSAALPEESDRGREAPREGRRDRLSNTSATTETHHLPNGDAENIEGKSKNHRACSSCMRATFAVVSLALTLLLAMDVYLVCWDAYRYGTQPDSPNDHRHQDALRLLLLFVPALLECGAMVVFLLRQLRPREICAASTLSDVAVEDTENLAQSRAGEEEGEVSERKKKLCWCVVLVALSLFTDCLYLCVFHDAIYPLRHLALHVACVWVTFFRSLAFSLFMYAVLCP